MTSLRLIAGQAYLEIEAAGQIANRTASHLRKILELSSHAGEVVRRIRDFVRDQPPTSEDVDLRQVHGSVQSLMGDHLQSKGTTLDVSVDTDPIYVLGDRVQLAQVLLNVYRNAIEAVSGQARGLVMVQVGGDQTCAWVRVSDNGPGLSAQVLAQGREGFFSTKSGGLGVGLLISRQIIEAHGGQLSLNNQPGGGACVKISLPRRPPRAGAVTSPSA